MKDKIVVKINDEEIKERELEYIIENTKPNKKINPKVQKKEFIEGVIATELLVQYAKKNKIHEDEEFKIAMKYLEKETLAKIVIQEELDRIVSSGETKVSEDEIDEYLKKDPSLVSQFKSVVNEKLKDINETEKETYCEEKLRAYVRNLLEKMKLGLKQGEFIKKLRSEANIEYK
ncbi:hypothetical protein [Clostridium oceanicum]|uniref:Trigger factor n=1 Tax=Clostridium oceanicum TaxID=1543 RepID=A0ABP3UHT1_9CLOT